MLDTLIFYSFINIFKIYYLMLMRKTGSLTKYQIGSLLV